MATEISNALDALSVGCVRERTTLPSLMNWYATVLYQQVIVMETRVDRRTRAGCKSSVVNDQPLHHQ